MQFLCIYTYFIISSILMYSKNIISSSLYGSPEGTPRIFFCYLGVRSRTPRYYLRVRDNSKKILRDVIFTEIVLKCETFWLLHVIYGRCHSCKSPPPTVTVLWRCDLIGYNSTLLNRELRTQVSDTSKSAS